jgi:hypothetical protein
LMVERNYPIFHLVPFAWISHLLYHVVLLWYIACWIYNMIYSWDRHNQDNKSKTQDDNNERGMSILLFTYSNISVLSLSLPYLFHTYGDYLVTHLIRHKHEKNSCIHRYHRWCFYCCSCFSPDISFQYCYIGIITYRYSFLPLYFQQLATYHR